MRSRIIKPYMASKIERKNIGPCHGLADANVEEKMEEATHVLRMHNIYIYIFSFMLLAFLFFFLFIFM